MSLGLSYGIFLFEFALNFLRVCKLRITIYFLISFVLFIAISFIASDELTGNYEI